MAFEDVAKFVEDVQHLREAWDAMLAENERYKKALRFYADEHSWQGLVHRSNGVWEGWDGTLVANDAGEIAREALAPTRQDCSEHGVGVELCQAFKRDCKPVLEETVHDSDAHPAREESGSLNAEKGEIVPHGKASDACCPNCRRGRMEFGEPYFKCKACLMAASKDGSK